MPASHFDVNSMTGRPKFIVRHSTSCYKERLNFENTLYTIINLSSLDLNQGR
jgi:hypothetical protein